MWNKKLEIGAERLDSQHEELFQVMGRIQSSLKKTVRASDYKQHCMNALYFLKNYVKQHFSEEEAYMDSVGYGDAEAHKKFHKILTNTLHDFEERVIKSDYDSSIIRLSLDGVVARFISHVLTEDQKIPKADSAKPVRVSAVVRDAEPETPADSKPVAPVVKSGKLGKSALYNFTEEIARRTDHVLQIMGGIDDVRVTIGANIDLGTDIGFSVSLVGEANKTLGFIYSQGLALKVFKTMAAPMGIKDATSVDAIVMSALNEVSCIIAGKLADVIAARGVPCDIKAPVQVHWQSFPEHADHILISTKFGDMVVMFYDTNS